MTLEHKAESAVGSYLKGCVPADVYAGFRREEKNIPNVVAEVSDIEELHPNSGNYRILVDVTTMTHADNNTVTGAAGAHESIAGAVSNALERDDLREQLTVNGTGFLVVGIESTTESPSHIDEVDEVPVYLSKYQLRFVAGHK